MELGIFEVACELAAILKRHSSTYELPLVYLSLESGPITQFDSGKPMNFPV